MIVVAFAVGPVLEVGPSFFEAGSSALGEVAVSGLTLGHAILRQMILVFRQFEIAHLCDGHGVQKRFRQFAAEDLPHLRGGADVELPLFVLEAALFVYSFAGTNAYKDVVGAPIILHQVMTVVG